MAGSGAKDTRTKLLAAAERILVLRGITGISVRKVGEEAHLNPTLVTYHFGSLGKMLEELCRLNIAPVLAGWEKVGEAEGFDAILHAWLLPLLHPAAFTPGGRALVVLDEIAVHGEAELGDQVLSEMEAFSQYLREVLTPYCPGLDAHELRARLRFVSAAALGPPPRSKGAPILEDGRAMDDMSFLLPFARAALST